MSRYRSPYGCELIMDLHDCDPATFTRWSLRSFFRALCKATDMTMCDVHFWDDVGVAPAERQTAADTKGTSAVCFILTSTIVVHTLDERREVFVNFFSCKEFDAEVAHDLIMNWFKGIPRVMEENIEFNDTLDEIFLVARG